MSSAFEGIEEAGTLPPGPGASLEFRRIQALPRRVWDKAADLEDLTAGLTQMLRAPKGEWVLKVTQAAALRDLHDFGGLFGPIAVGGGKTLITLLAPVLMKAKRPVLLVPAALRDQTMGKVLPAMFKQWRLNHNLKVIGYSELSQQKNAEMLEDIQPDMIIADECHMLKNPKSARTRRVSRYMSKHPMTTFIAVSGTVANHSIMHYWHIIQWALKPDNAPIPRNFYEAKEWACALDERVADEDRVGPGALATLAGPGESARQGYRRRLTETPGVLATHEDEVGVSLQLLRGSARSMPSEVNKLIKHVRSTWETPDGEVIMEAVECWRIIRQLVAGFYYRWAESPPAEWMDARKEWGRFVRGTLRSNRRKLDTPLQVWKDVEKNGGPGARLQERWRRVKDSYRPVTVPVWVDDYLVNLVRHWLDYRAPVGICWVEYHALGERIARAAGVPFFGAGNSRILDYDEPCVASIAAHGTGKNLQQWSRNLVVIPPTSGQTWEQLLGRTHRQGQRADTVTCETYLHHSSYMMSMEQAFADARFLQETLGNRQRLLYCDSDFNEEQLSHMLRLINQGDPL